MNIPPGPARLGMLEADGSWWAWISWVQDPTGRPKHLVVQIRATRLKSLEDPEAYANVTRRVRGNDGVIRPWSGEVK